MPINFLKDLSFEMPKLDIFTRPEEVKMMKGDLFQTKIDGLSNVWDIMRNRKPMMQWVCLLFFNIGLDMLEASMQLEDQTIMDQMMEVARAQLTDAIQRTSWI